jgi:hypothetical protein
VERVQGKAPNLAHVETVQMKLTELLMATTVVAVKLSETLADYTLAIPRFANSSMPRINLASLEAMKDAALATSSGRPISFAGNMETIFFFFSSASSSGRFVEFQIGVSIGPGADYIETYFAILEFHCPSAREGADGRLGAAISSETKKRRPSLLRLTAQDLYCSNIPANQPYSRVESLCRRPVMKTYAPSATNSTAVANPIPLLPPVITAIVPWSLVKMPPPRRRLDFKRYV